ncbi:hypothetical protein ACFVFS_17375 [Kitasatospora sp. NPDC057692]|uniref:hypothetical protein n=1 Tax=Kitasatospora sp. NPDC057692 TaxID=3346215 RepID=UPI0036D12FD7
MVRYPNPPLASINPRDLYTREDLAEQFEVDPNVISTWVKRRRIEHVPLPGGPRLYHLPTAARAEHDAWQHGADRPARGGRRPGWHPRQAAA